MTAQRANRLAGETSPYLLQHADNPVDWYPWCEEAFEKARAENRPVLLSIGYSACHWCHVMAHESFEDEAVAEVMNRHFVNIKVDREERPDLDRIYQLAHQILTQRPGGWPLTMFLTPDDQVPFFGGTYFPRDAMYGLPSFRDLLLRIAEYYREHEGDLRDQNVKLMNVFRQLERTGAEQPGELDGEPLSQARGEMQQTFDERHGGFGDAPRFPHPTGLQGLMRRWHRAAREGEPDGQALYMATHTLRCMAEGGVYDQVGGGFYRYAVDERWEIPHFEKMLYDNGPLLALYAQAWAATGDALFRRIAHETADWVTRDMQSARGGFYATLDADSEGEEGRFYLWTPESASEVLPEEEYRVAAAHYGLDGDANFEGSWHLRVHRGIDDVARELGESVETVRERLESARRRLREARDRRVWPARDEKVLTAWNGMMIRGLAIAARHLERHDLAEAATRALDFIRAELWRDGRLLAVYKDGVAHGNAFLDDHADLIDGILALLEVRWRREDLDFALQLAELLLDHFEDEDNGGFFQTSDDHEELIYRPKPFTDESVPSGNGVAAQVFTRLGHLIGEPRYLEAAERTLKAARSSIGNAPHAHYALLVALEDLLFPPTTVLLRGEPEAIAPWLRECHQGYTPDRLHLAVPADEPGLPGALAERPAEAGATAYVCEGMTCKAPITDLAALRRELGLP